MIKLIIEIILWLILALMVIYAGVNVLELIYNWRDKDDEQK